MASNSDMVSVAEQEFSCPICLDLFEEPKCLPNCAHNVCGRCLEGMEKLENNSIECPVCRVKSMIPKDGIAAFPKNHLLVRLIEHTPGLKEKQTIEEVMKNCKQQLEEAKSAVKSMEVRFACATREVDQTKQRIKALAEYVVTMLREQERKMLDEIDEKWDQSQPEKKFEAKKASNNAVCDNASSCIQTVEDILHNGELSDLKDLKDALVEEMGCFSSSLKKSIAEVNREFAEPFGVSLTDTGSVEGFIENNCLLGKLTINTAPASCHQEISSVSNGPSVDSKTNIDYSRCGSLIQTIDSSSCGIAQFTPLSVAVSRNTGHFVALDEEMKRVHIFNEDGEALHTFRIMYGDLWDIAVSIEDEIIVVNRESNRLLHYDMNGNFRRKFVTTPKENVKFTSLSVDYSSGCLIVTSHPSYSESEDDTLPRVLVYSPVGIFTTSFGEGRLSSPEKAVFLNGKYFVVDSSRQSVVVFNKDGEFHKEFGSGQLECPCSIAADYNTGSLIVCNRGNCTLHIYSQNGELLHHFRTEHPPMQVALSKSYDNLLICCQVEDNKKNIQMITHV